LLGAKSLVIGFLGVSKCQMSIMMEVPETIMNYIKYTATVTN